MSMYNSSTPNQIMTVQFKADVELTWYMIFMVAIIYLVYAIIGVQAIIAQDYYCFKHVVFAGQFIHLLSMLAVDLPPPFIYLIQRMSIFGFIEGIFSKGFALSIFNFMEIDRFYRANYETTSFLSNQMLSVFITMGVLAVFGLRQIKFKKPKVEAKKNEINLDAIDEADTASASSHSKYKENKIAIAKRIGFNMFAFLYPYIILNAIIDISNRSFKNPATTISFLLSCFLCMVIFKLSILISVFVVKKYLSIKHAYGEEETIHDSLFSNLRIKYMILTHLLFWSKRCVIILIIVISPYMDNYFTIIAGFIVLLAYTSLELDYRATDNPLEYIYILLCYAPPLITSFMAMLMEGHYISYNAKYAATIIMVVLITCIYITIVPFRFYDYYRYQKFLKLKRQAKYKAEKVNNTTNMTNSFMGRDNALSISQYTNEPSKSKFEDIPSPSNASYSSTPYSAYKSDPNGKSIKDDSDEKGWKMWKRKGVDAYSPDKTDKSGKDFHSIYNAPKPAMTLAVEEVKSPVFKEEAKSAEPPQFIGSASPASQLAGITKKFSLPEY